MNHKIYYSEDRIRDLITDYPVLNSIYFNENGVEALIAEEMNKLLGYKKYHQYDLITASLINDFLDKLEMKGVI